MPPAGAKKVAEATPQNIAAAPMPAVELVAPRSAPTEALKVEPPRPEPARLEPPKPELAKVEPPKAEPQRVEAPRKPEPPKAEAAKKPEPPKAEAAKKPPEVVRVSSGLSDPTLARTLKLRFKGESWVEIRDRSGKILLSRINSPGSEAEVSGRPPFNVVVGNAPDVQMLYDDREFPLEPHTKVAVARFTVRVSTG